MTLHDPVEEEWEADRVTFRFPTHPRSRALAVVAFVVKWLLLPILVPIALYGAAFASSVEPNITLLLAIGLLTVVILAAMGVAPIFFWPDTERLVGVAISRHRVTIGDREFWRSEVLAISVRRDRLIVVSNDGSIYRTEPLAGLRGGRIKEALERFTPTHDERIREELAAAEASARLEPLRSRS